MSEAVEKGFVVHRAYLEHQSDVVKRDSPDVATKSGVCHCDREVSKESRFERGRMEDELIWRIVVEGISSRKDTRIVQSSHPRVFVP